MSLSSCYTHSIANLDKIDITVSSIKIMLLGKTVKILRTNSSREVASTPTSSWLPFKSNLNLTDNRSHAYICHSCTHRDFLSFSFCKHC